MRTSVRVATVLGAVGLTLFLAAAPPASAGDGVTAAQETKPMIFYGDGRAATELAATYKSEDAARWQMAYYSRVSDWHCRADGPYEKTESSIDAQEQWRVRGRIPAICLYYPAS